ncbi:hypothetical protein SpCBS45565_g02199 [Spizellomyces sp. 'palustris']|nr:hypothetical protein SpCBS45565_g02199 [Spizellomyces sp. 'palustris']
MPPLTSATWFDYDHFSRNLNVCSNPTHPIPLNDLLYTGDPIADAAYTSVKRSGPPYRIFDDILVKRDTGDHELTGTERAFLREVEHVPEWVDWEKVNRGREVFWRNMGAIQVVLLYASLAGGFSIPRVNDVLIRTGYLSHPRHINRRLLETGQMINDIMQHGLRPGSDGWKSVLRVRFLHCAVRKRQLPENGIDTGSSKKIIPINQTDLIGTLLGFQCSVITGLTYLWIYLTPSERDDYTHLWRYVGYLIGVKEENNPLAHGFEATCACLRDYLELYFVPDHTSTQLSQTLLKTVSSSDGSKSKRASYELNVSITRRFLSPELADALELPLPTLRYRLLALLFCWVVWVFGVMGSLPGIGGRVIEGRKKRMARIMEAINSKSGQPSPERGVAPKDE